MNRAAMTMVFVIGACGGDPPPPQGTGVAPVLPVEPGVLRLAGSGTLVPLARAVGAAVRASAPNGPRIVVEDSIGSGGGIRAALDGAVDVGLISRRLSAKEAALPLVVLPVGRDAVILAAHPDVAVDGVTAAEVVALYSGARHQFTDGMPAKPLLRDRGESANLALDAGIPGMAEARERAYHLGYRVLYHDDAMAAALAVTPGAIGVYSLGLLRATRIPVKVLRLDGRAPSAAALADGSWPLTRPLALVLRADRVDHARAFLSFIASPAGNRLIADSGYLPPVPEPLVRDPARPSRAPIPAAAYAEGATQ